MKKLFTVFIIFSISLVAQSKFSAGAGFSYLMPMGELSNRFKPGIGSSLFFSQDVSPVWTWTGKVEYLFFDKLNEDKMQMKREIMIGTESRTFTYPIKNLKMDLKAFGASVQADYSFFKNSYLESKINVGFGIYKWNFSRGSYTDSLFAPDTAGVNKLQEVLKVPSLDQEDWSGTFNVGLEIDVQIYDPVWFGISANYKNILGELWSTLKLDFENVASMQMIELRATLRAKF